MRSKPDRFLIFSGFLKCLKLFLVGGFLMLFIFTKPEKDHNISVFCC